MKDAAKSRDKTPNKASSIFGVVVTVVLVAVAIVVCTLGFVGSSKAGVGAGSQNPAASEFASSNTPDFSDVQSISQLATLKCYYHNVAHAETEQQDNPLGWVFHSGYKKVWLEYDGIVTVGVDASQITISQPDANNVVMVHVPDATIQSVQIDYDSLGDPITDTGMFTNVTDDEKTQMLVGAQNDMRDTAEQNSSLKQQGTDRAKDLIREWVENTGSQVGQTYTVRFN